MDSVIPATVRIGNRSNVRHRARVVTQDRQTEHIGLALDGPAGAVQLLSQPHIARSLNGALKLDAGVVFLDPVHRGQADKDALLVRTQTGLGFLRQILEQADEDGLVSRTPALWVADLEEVG